MHEYGQQEPVPAGHRTWHMTPSQVWDRQQGNLYYLPEAYDTEGFIHCTDQMPELIAVGNRYYRQDSRPFVALEIECDLVQAPVVYEDPGRIFPHIFGPLHTRAITRTMTLIRDHSGVFLDLEQS